jgi:predicted HD phosphohydrolase
MKTLDRGSMQIVSFRRMEDGTPEDFELLDRIERQQSRCLPDVILATLMQLEDSTEALPVTRLEHSLQAATRAMRADADEELILAALVHDIGDNIAPCNHSEIAAGIVRPYVRPEVTWIVQQHGLFQKFHYVHHLGGNRNARDRFGNHPWFESCKDFCSDWDQCSFDPEYPSKPLSFFEPLVRRIFTRRAHDPRYVASA